MTEPVTGADHYVAIFVSVITFASTFFMSRVGSSEGRRAAVEVDEPNAVGGVIRASMIDIGTYGAIEANLALIAERVEEVVKRLDTLIETTEGKEERALRDNIRDDLRSEMDKLITQMRQMSDTRSAIRTGPAKG